MARLRAGFALVPEWVDERVADGTAMRLYVRLARKYADRERHAFPLEDTLAGELGCSERTVRRAVGQLREIGAIVVERERRDDGSYGRNLYSLPMDESLQRPDTTCGSDQQKQDVPPARDHRPNMAGGDRPYLAGRSEQEGCNKTAGHEDRPPAAIFGRSEKQPDPPTNQTHNCNHSDADASVSGADAPGTDAAALCGGRSTPTALFDLGEDLAEDSWGDLGTATGSRSSRSKKPGRGRGGRSAPNEEQSQIIRSLVGAWVDAFQANHPGLRPTKSQRGQVGRGIKELVLAGNPTGKIQSAAEYAGGGGVATVVNEFVRIHSSSNGRDRRIRRQDLPAEDWRRFVQE